MTERSVFRQKALDRLASPEQLDQLMQVASPGGWLALFCLSGFVVVGLGWSVFGRLPIAVAGQGVMIRPGKVVDLQATVSGQLSTLNVRVGDAIRKGQILATLSQSELEKELQQQQAKLLDLQLHNTSATTLQSQRVHLEQRSLQQRRNILERRIQQAEAMAPRLLSKGLDAIAGQRRSIEQSLNSARQQAPVLKARLDQRKDLQIQGAISKDAVLEAEQIYLQSLDKISALEAQIKELEVQETQTEQTFQENLTLIADLNTQLKQLDNQETNLVQQNLEINHDRAQQIQEVKRAIAQLELKLKNTTEIVSEYDGRILEVSATQGQVIGQGTRLGSIEQSSNTKLVAIVYFPIKDGKRLKPGMKLQVTPDTVKRERFGGMVGTVKSISPFPITAEGANNRLGNPELVKRLAASEPQIEVMAELEPDRSTFSGFRWSSSQGPQLEITSGTTASVRVTVDEQAPITLILPFLKSVTGVY
jgi:HlyD family secretion protein